MVYHHQPVICVLVEVVNRRTSLSCSNYCCKLIRVVAVAVASINDQTLSHEIFVALEAASDKGIDIYY